MGVVARTEVDFHDGPVADDGHGQVGAASPRLVDDLGEQAGFGVPGGGQLDVAPERPELVRRREGAEGGREHEPACVLAPGVGAQRDQLWQQVAGHHPGASRPGDVRGVGPEQDGGRLGQPLVERGQEA